MINLIFPDNTEQTVETQADGSFTFTIPKQKGGTLLTLIALNKTGQKSDPLELVVKDTQKPNQPIVTALTNQSTVLSGTADPDLTYELVLPDGTIVTGTVLSDGTFEIPIPTPTIGDSFKLTIIKVSNNTTSDVLIITVEDDSIPAPPTLDPVTDSSTSVSGLGAPGTTAFLTLPSGEVLETTVNEKGEFSFTIEPQVVGSQLTVYLTHSNGNSSDPVVVSVDPSTSSIILDVEEISTLSHEVTGVTEPNQTVTIQTEDGKSYTGKSNLDGSFAIPIPSQKAGTQLIVSVEKEGQPLKSVSMTVRDLSAPIAPTVNEVTDKSTKLTGQSEIGTIVSITLPDGTIIESDTVKSLTKTNQATGDFSVDIPTQKADTTISIYAKKENGLVSPPVMITVKDVTAPEKARIIEELTVHSTYLTGQGEPLSTVEVTMPDGSLLQATVDEKRLFSVPLPTLNAADKLTITLIDKAGNRSLPLELTVKAVTDSSSTDPSTSSTTDLSSTSDTQSSETTTEESSTHENSFSSSKDSSSNSNTSKPSQQKQYNNDPKKNLPETGERTSSTILQIIGLLLLIESFFQKKKTKSL